MSADGKDPAVTKVFGQSPGRGRVLFIVFGFLIQLCLGAVYAWSTFSGAVKEHYTLNNTEALLPYIIFLLCFAILMPFGGRWIQKYGPRRIGIIGGTLVGIGWILSGFATNLPALCVTYGVIAGVGVGLCYGGPIAVVNRWFPDRKGLAVGLTVGGFGLSAAIVSPLGYSLISSYGIMDAFKILGIAFLIITVILSLTMRFPASDWMPAGWSGPKTGGTAIESFSPRQMVKTRGFIALFLCYVFGCTAGLMAIGIGKTVGTDVISIASGTAATLIAVFAAFNFAGRPLFGWLTDRITPRFSGLISFVLIAVGSIGMLFARQGDIALYIGSMSVMWMALGGWLAIAPTTTASFFGPRENASNYGIVFLAYGIGAVIGNIVAGRAKDLFGSFDIAFWVTLILAIAGMAIALVMLKKPREKPVSSDQ
ncbi:MAG: OFA family MFS transporter [Dehalococcoidales bacterium]|nr:OFA family MFS transporter [Dehalococcoidales bacterium]